MKKIYTYLRINDFRIKKVKNWFKIVFLNWFNDYVYIKSEKELNKLYRISNEYNISRSKDLLIKFINNPSFW